MPRIRLPRPLWIALATGMLVVTAVGVRVGMPIYQRHAAIRTLEQHGAYIEMVDATPDWVRHWAGRELSVIFGEPYSVFVIDENPRFDDDAMSVLPTLTELIEFGAEGTAVTDAGIRHLKQATTLEDLWLSDLPI